jgi:plastocyanin
MLKFVALAAIIAVIGVPAAGAVTGKLVATDGPGFVVSVKQGGKTVKTLKAGTYTITVQDKSNIHDFHLTGPGVNKVTSVTAVKTYTWNLTLKKGTYKFVCDPHKSFMKGSFTVT